MAIKQISSTITHHLPFSARDKLDGGRSYPALYFQFYSSNNMFVDSLPTSLVISLTWIINDNMIPEGESVEGVFPNVFYITGYDTYGRPVAGTSEKTDENVPLDPLVTTGSTGSTDIATIQYNYNVYYYSGVIIRDFDLFGSPDLRYDIGVKSLNLDYDSGFTA